MISSVEVAIATYPVVLFRKRYEQTEVSAFVGQIVKALAAYEGDPIAAPPLSSAEVSIKKFSHPKYGAGYEQSSVDRLIRRAAEALREFEMKKAENE